VLSQALANFFAGELVPLIGWRHTFILVGGFGALLLLPPLLAVGCVDAARTGDGRLAARSQAAAPACSVCTATLHALYVCPALVLTLMGGTFLNVMPGIESHEQAWLTLAKGFGRTDAANASAWSTLVFGTLGTVYAGVGGDWLHLQCGRGRALAFVLAAAFLLPLVIGYLAAPKDSVRPDSGRETVGKISGYGLSHAVAGPGAR
jgi:hypothetical protein